MSPVRTRSRDSALASAIEAPDQLVIHEQAADPMIYRAASELIRLDDEGNKTNIEAQGKVYDVLQSIEGGLKEVGANHLTISQVLDTLADYVSDLGADFARQAKAKPLYARVMVTDREPEDIPDCKLHSVTCIDGQRIQGDDAGKMSMTLTLYGTSNAMSQGMSMNRIFESGKKKWLMVYYGTIEGSDLNKFDTVDADLATLIQAVGAGGAASMEEIREAIEQGMLPPEIMNLIAAIADLNRALEAAKTPGALENPEKTIADLKALVAEMAQAVPDLQALPQELIQAAVQSIESAETVFAKADPEPVQPPSNDNDTVIEQTQSLLEQIAELLQDETLPPEVKEKLIAFSEEISAALPEKNFAALETVMTGLRETLVDFAASDSISPQMFRTISEILPAVVVAEKQIGEVIARPPVAEGFTQDTADAIPADLAQVMNDLKLLTGEKIQIILQDETVAPEIKDRLREIVKAVEAAVENKDFSKLALAVTDIRQTMGELALTQSLPPQIMKAVAEILPAIAASEQKIGEILPRMQAEKILDAIVMADQKMQTGEIKIDAAQNPQLAEALAAIKETIQQEGPEAAVQKIADILKTPTPEGATHPLVEALVKQPELLLAMSPDMKEALIAAIPPTDINMRVQLAVMGIETPMAIHPEKFVESFDAIVKQVQAEAKTDPAKAEIAKLLTDMQQGMQGKDPAVAIQNLLETLKAPGAAHPIFEAIVQQPSLLQAMPADVRQVLAAAVPAGDVVLRAQLAAAGLEMPKPPLPQKFSDGLENLIRQVQAEAKIDPAKQEVVKLLVQIGEATKINDPKALADKITEVLKMPAQDGKPHPLVEVLAKQPGLLETLPSDTKKMIFDSVPAHDTALRAQLSAIGINPPQALQTQKFSETIDTAIRQIQMEARIDPAKREVVEILTQIKEAIKTGSPEKLGEGVKAAGVEGKLSVVIDRLAEKPELLNAIPPETRAAIVQAALASGDLSLKQQIIIATTERQGVAFTEATPERLAAKMQADAIVNTFDAIDQKIKSGEINRNSPENARIIEAVEQFREQFGKKPEQFMENLQKSLADPSSNPRAVAVLATITPEVLTALPVTMREPILQMQRDVFVASARETVLGQQLVPINHENRHALQALIEKSGLQATERDKLIRDLQSGQTSVENLRHIMNRIETTTPGMNTHTMRAEVDRLSQRAAQDMDSRTYPVMIDPAIKTRVFSAIAQLPLPESTIKNIVMGVPPTKSEVAAIIVAAGANRSPELAHYIREATKQVAIEHAKPIVELAQKGAIPGLTARDLNDLKEGNFISAARMQRIMDNPQVPLPVVRKLEEYQVVQKQLAPYVAPVVVQRELRQIQQVLIQTNPAAAKSVDTFLRQYPDATAKDFERYVTAMPEHARASIERAADIIGRSAEQSFVPANRAEFVQMLEKASFQAEPHQKPFLNDMMNHARMGGSFARSELDYVVSAAKLDKHEALRLSDNMKPAEQQSGISSLCGHCGHKNCSACKYGFVLAMEAKGKDAGAMASIESPGYSYSIG